VILTKPRFVKDELEYQEPPIIAICSTHTGYELANLDTRCIITMRKIFVGFVVIARLLATLTAPYGVVKYILTLVRRLQRWGLDRIE